MVILTTAFPNYALEGFQFDVVDYILKPITFNRFFKATNKAKELYLLKNQSQSSIQQEPEYIFVKCESRYERILIDEILFVQALQNYVIIFTVRGKFMTLLPLKSVENFLKPSKFLKVHKSYIVAIYKINSIENQEILIESNRIPISRTMRDSILRIVVDNNLLKR